MYSSISKMKSDRKPPLLPRSPVRLRSRPVLHPPTSLTLQTPPGSLTKYQKQPARSPGVGESSALRPEYSTISCELRALAKMVRDEFGKTDSEDVSGANSVNAGVVFERGRFYNEYSARRNERLKRKKGVMVDEGKPVHALGVTMESGKKTSCTRSLKRSVSAAYSMEMQASETPRYMLRSRCKENKKPPLPTNLDKSVLGGEKKTTRARRAGRI